MNIATLDLEGVLVPEIWIAFAEVSGISELRRTTRDEPDYDKLMKFRLEILGREGVRLSDIEKAISSIEPFEGAAEFMKWLVSRCRAVVLSDTFEQFARPLMEKLGYPPLFCHELVVGSGGKITGYTLRMRDQKRAAVEAFKNLNFKVVSVGDSYNDLSMLRAADKAVLYRPTEKFAAENSDLPVAQNYEELKETLETFLKG